MVMGLLGPFVSMQETFGDVNILCPSYRLVEISFFEGGCVMTLSPWPVVLCKPLAL